MQARAPELPQHATPLTPSQWTIKGCMEAPRPWVRVRLWLVSADMHAAAVWACGRGGGCPAPLAGTEHMPSIIRFRTRHSRSQPHPPLIPVRGAMGLIGCRWSHMTDEDRACLSSPKAFLFFPVAHCDLGVDLGRSGVLQTFYIGCALSFYE